MKLTEQEKKRNDSEIEIKTFTVPYALKELKNKIPVSINTNDKNSKEILIKQAFKFHSEGNTPKAAKFYQEFINKGFKDHKTFSNYGILLKSLGNFKEAILFTRKAIELKPDYPTAHYNLGNTLLAIGQLKEAELSTRKAIELNPDFPDAHSNLGTILRDLGQLKEAELSTRKAIKLNPDFPDAHSNLGTILRDLGQLKEAELSTRKAIELNPDYIIAYSNLGTILRDLGKLKDAELSTRKAIKLNPDCSDAYSNLGTILRDLGKLKDAEFSQRKAIKLNPYSSIAHYNLGMILTDIGNSKDAESSLKKALQLEPNLTCAVEELARRLYLNKKYNEAIEYLRKNNSYSCQSLYLSCLLCLDQEEEFDKKLKELSPKKICNADMSGIIEHANIIYEKSNESHFCNKAIKYIVHEKINEDLFSEKHFKQLILYLKSDELKTKPQSLIHEAAQSTGNLFSLNYPFIHSLKKALEIKIELYKEKFKDSKQGFIINWPTEYTLRSWILCMKTGGFIKPHNHRYGWITGSFYLQVPKDNKNDNSGNISFSYKGPEYPTKGKIFNSKIKRIETRDICIFPSSLFHHTIPFKSTEERICLVFDLVKRYRS